MKKIVQIITFALVCFYLVNTNNLFNLESIRIEANSDFSMGGYQDAESRVGDITPPTLDISSIRVTPKEATIGDRVKVSLRASDDLSGIESIMGYYLAPQSNEQIAVFFNYNESKDEYETYLDIRNYTPSGTWKIHFLSLFDNAGNQLLASNTHLDLQDAEKMNLSGGDFKVVNTKSDITPPTLDISSIRVTPKEATIGDRVKVSLKASDDLSGIKSIMGYYLAPQSNEQIAVSFNYNESKDEYETYLDIRNYTPSGTWKIHFLSLFDNAGNQLLASNTHLDLQDAEKMDLSGGDFRVVNKNDYIKRVSYFRAENNQLYIDGYSYVKGINIPNKSDIIQKLKFVDVNSGKQVKTYELPNFYSTAASKDPNHGSGIYNYDWAKFKGYLDINDLPIGDYYIKIYTNAKKNTYDEIIDFHSSIGDFNFITNGKEFKFVREGNTLRLSVTEVQAEQPIPGENSHMKRVSYFRAENGKLFIDGYSYVIGINIPNQSDIIQKLKFVDVNSGKQVKTYELPNFYSTAVSKDPNHGSGIYNYDWAKFKGYLDVSDLPIGEYYIKIYTNAKGNKYDEVINFHSSINDFLYETNEKKFNFIREGSTLKLEVE